MWERLKEWLLRRDLSEGQGDGAAIDDYASRYETEGNEEVTAIIAGKLAMLTFADSTMAVEDSFSPEAPGARVTLIRYLLQELWQCEAQRIVAQMLGKGGKVLVPTCNGTSIGIRAIDQGRMMIREMNGSRITAATLLVDLKAAPGVSGGQLALLADYDLTGGVQHIRYRAVRSDGIEVPLDAEKRWAGIAPEIGIAGADRLLFAYLRCPRDNRREDQVYGVPITCGAERAIAELKEHCAIYRREYKLTRPMLGLDASLWRNPGAPTGESVPEINRLRRTVQDSDDPFVPFDSPSLDAHGAWQYYAPSIRHEAMDARYQMLLRRVERACGLSQGILTERKSMNYANRDEVRAAQYDSFSVVLAVRDVWDRGMDELACAIDVLAEHYGLTPAGSRNRHRLRFDWDVSLIESTEQTFEQYRAMHAGGLLGSDELRQWVMGGSLEENRRAIARLREVN